MKTLMHFRDFVNEIMESNSRIHKQNVLKKYKDDEVVKKYLQIAFDPYTRFGLSYAKLGKQVMVGDTWCAPTVFDLFEYLKENNTGRDVDIAVCQLAFDWLTQDVECAELLGQLICKDVTLGVDAKTINKEIPDLIPTFSVQLANKYFDKPEYVEGKEFAITTKIDGGRIIAVKENGSVSFFTRAGQRYEGLVDLETEMAEIIPDNYVLDGEITLLNYKDYDSKTAYKLAMKITRADGEKHGVKMLVFDGMPITEWKYQKSNFSWSDRRLMLACMTGFYNNSLTYFELLPILYRGTDTSKILELLESEIARNQEGVMINICDAPYEFKRTWNLQKVKKFQSLDLLVVDMEEGEGRLAGTLGAIHVRYKDGNTVKVGSGFSDEERKLYWEHPDLIMNKVAEIKYFSESEDSGGNYSLRFPTWTSNIRDPRDKATPDF